MDVLQLMLNNILASYITLQKRGTFCHFTVLMLGKLTVFEPPVGESCRLMLATQALLKLAKLKNETLVKMPNVSALAIF